MIRLLLTSGRGPAECRIALTKTLRILASEADAAGITVDVAVDKRTRETGSGSRAVRRIAQPRFCA
jgi:peptide chain release factor